MQTDNLIKLLIQSLIKFADIIRFISTFNCFHLLFLGLISVFLRFRFFVTNLSISLIDWAIRRDC